ncbi:MAG: 2-amino-4-hydroxy-6-hydroxymethyldihydropteridine diphosphokinase [Phycisphaerales bacterium]|nr:2-amino-4-hydroxy-6-hydroxymethyldihydropteridine diphosphokinase [Phycisphaerales bacterium]
MNNARVFILLGGNIGNTLAIFSQAKNLIEQNGSVIIQSSSVYQTAPWGNIHQNDFLNQALELETPLTPLDLLKSFLQIEHRLGRIRTADKMGSRIIDIDIILFNNQIIDTPDISVPHPSFRDRRFVLVPLVELNPDFIDPVSKKSLALLLEECTDPLPVTIVMGND